MRPYFNFRRYYSHQAKINKKYTLLSYLFYQPQQRVIECYGYCETFALQMLALEMCSRRCRKQSLPFICPVSVYMWCVCSCLFHGFMMAKEEALRRTNMWWKCAKLYLFYEAPQEIGEANVKKAPQIDASCSNRVSIDRRRDWWKEPGTMMLLG